MLDEIAASDPIHILLDSLIQARIYTPRAQLSEAQIMDALRKFDPAAPVWPQTGTGMRKAAVPCPSCGHPGLRGRVCNSKRRYYCRACHRTWHVEREL